MELYRGVIDFIPREDLYEMRIHANAPNIYLAICMVGVDYVLAAANASARETCKEFPFQRCAEHFDITKDIRGWRISLAGQFPVAASADFFDFSLMERRLSKHARQKNPAGALITSSANRRGN